ncbi:MAG TPA: polysaccharide deacetylase family protein, partial [Kofleriaceae bacterium]
MKASISIDLDGIACYYKIHALGPPPAELQHAILERALPRAAALFARHGIHVTWFVVGGDVDGHAGNAERLKALAAAGDELGNHSYSHPYELARLPQATVDREITRCDQVLRTLTARVHGFRAPGYDVSAGMFDVLARLGYRYDSSVFPSPGYYAAKAAVLSALAAL